MDGRPRPKQVAEAERPTGSVLSAPTFRRIASRLWGAVRRRRSPRAPRPTTTFTREGVYFLGILGAVFLFAIIGDVNLLMVLAGMLLASLWINYRLVDRTLRGLEIRRHMPRSVAAGELLLVGLELANTRRRGGSWAVEVRNRLVRQGSDDSPEPLEPAVLFVYVRAGQTRSGVYRARLPRRGRYLVSPAVVSTRYPFGFCRRSMVVGSSDTLLVLPRLGRLTPRWLTRPHQSFEGTRRREHRSGRISGEFYGVRPWRQGDSLRHVHWRSSARHGSLVVKQFEQHRNRDVAVVLDLGQPGSPSPEHRENLELAVSFAATVVADTCQRGGGSMWVGTAAAEIDVVQGAASPALMQEVMERLALVEPTGADWLPALLTRLVADIEAGTEVVLISTRAVDWSEPRLAHLGTSAVWRSIVPRLRTVDTSAPTLSDYFQAVP